MVEESCIKQSLPKDNHGLLTKVRPEDHLTSYEQFCYLFDSLEEQQEYLILHFGKGFFGIDINELVVDEVSQKYYNTSCRFLTDYNFHSSCFRLLYFPPQLLLSHLFLPYDDIHSMKVLPISLSYWCYYNVIATLIKHYNPLDWRHTRLGNFFHRLQYLSKRKYKRVPLFF